LTAMDGDMIRPIALSLCAAASLSMTAEVACAEETGANANDPVELAPDPALQSQTTAASDDAEPGDRDAAESIIRQAAQELPTRRTGETKPLGRPNGALSARPAEAEDGASPGGVLEKLDPRRNDLIRIVASLGAVLGLLFLLKRFLSRAPGWLGGAARPSGTIEILARYPVGRGQSLILLRLARRVLLVHQTSSSMATLSEMSDPQEVAALLARLEAGANERDAMRFRSTLRTFDAEYEKLGEQEAQRGARVQVVDLTRRRRANLSRRPGRGEESA